MNHAEGGCSSSVLKEDTWSTSNVNHDLKNDCPSGYKLENKQCVYRTTLIASWRYTCPGGYYYNGNRCAVNGTYWDFSKCNTYSTYANGRCYPTINETMEYYCYSGRLEGLNCITEQYKEPRVFYRCQQGYTLNSNRQCQKEY